MLEVFAHAGEDHTTTVNSSTHLLESWYISLPLLIFVATLVGYITYRLSKKSTDTTILVVNACLLVGGLLFYRVAPVAAAVALSAGFALALFSVLGGLSLDKPSAKKKRKK